MLGNIGTGEILVVALIMFFLFGGSKLPEFARGIGEAVKELKKARTDFDEAVTEKK